MGVHEGHRDRMKREFLQGGLRHFSEPRVLELLLFYSRLQGDVNPLEMCIRDRNVQHPHEGGADLGGQPNPLALAAGQGARLAAEGQIGQPHACLLYTSRCV